MTPKITHITQVLEPIGIDGYRPVIYAHGEDGQLFLLQGAVLKPVTVKPNV